MKKWLKYIGIVILLFVGFCFLPTTPDENLVLKIENLHIENSSYNFNKKYSILIDYNQPIFRKRLWVIENETKEIVCNSFVSQAKKSGWIWFNNSSNIPSSKISFVGLFKTLGTFESDYGKGEYKLGMQLKGLEIGINDNVTKRNIVFHPSYGLWSEGCFMTSPKVNKQIIDLTKGGSLLYVNFQN